MSMLGLVWKVFNMRKSSLSAEGNGYMVNSEYVPGLGILTRFSSVSKAIHEENRIIPCIELKRLCFGEVPSLFDTVGEILQVSPGRMESCLKRLLPKLDQEHRNMILGIDEGPSRSLIFPSKYFMSYLRVTSLILNQSLLRLSQCWRNPFISLGQGFEDFQTRVVIPGTWVWMQSLVSLRLPRT
jgi:hypothetical protein